MKEVFTLTYNKEEKCFRLANDNYSFVFDEEDGFTNIETVLSYIIAWRDYYDNVDHRHIILDLPSMVSVIPSGGRYNKR